MKQNLFILFYLRGTQDEKGNVGKVLKMNSLMKSLIHCSLSFLMFLCVRAHRPVAHFYFVICYHVGQL